MLRSVLLLSFAAMLVVATSAKAETKGKRIPIIIYRIEKDKKQIPHCEIPEPTVQNNFNKGGCCSGAKWFANCPD